MGHPASASAAGPASPPPLPHSPLLATLGPVVPLRGGLALRACGAWAVSRGSRRRWQRGRGAWRPQHPLRGPQHLSGAPSNPCGARSGTGGRRSGRVGQERGPHGADFHSLTLTCIPGRSCEHLPGAGDLRDGEQLLRCVSLI